VGGGGGLCGGGVVHLRVCALSWVRIRAGVVVVLSEVIHITYIYLNIYIYIYIYICICIMMKIKYLQRFTRVSLSYSGKATPESASATHVVTPRLCSLSLRVECLLKTDCGYPKDTGVTLYTLTTPRNPFRYNTPQSALPVSTLAHSRGPRKRSQSSVHML